ncbi:hypothetical protein [uncultured Acinetobacter sp.]|jgi:hypothetical protein|uniref:hypothetical protein n=1 Tax=uncultured Acinetobacter sp. TaxID=165433 RepID=UPI00260BCCED|nr:hypothetical protein [uncultured Acinetobacter sp.]
MNFLKLTSIALVISFSGCASVAVNNLRISDENLKKKAATALFTTEDKITISNKETTPNPKNPSVNSIRFVATLNQKQHLCFVPTSGNIIIADAICSGSELLNPNRKNK